MDIFASAPAYGAYGPTPAAPASADAQIAALLQQVRALEAQLGALVGSLGPVAPAPDTYVPAPAPYAPTPYAPPPAPYLPAPAPYLPAPPPVLPPPPPPVAAPAPYVPAPAPYAPGPYASTPYAPAALPSLSEMGQWFMGWLWGQPPAPAPAPAPAPSQPAPAPGGKKTTSFVVSSFNVLGSSHTRAGGNKPGMRSGPERMKDAVKLLQQHKVEVVGFQEFQGDQFKAFVKETGGRFGVYPGNQLGKKEVVNSIAWDKTKWDMVKPGHVDIPYFDGVPRKMPVVKLRNKATGQEAYFMNFHNPASTKTQGDHEKWRDIDTDKQIALVNKLRRETGLPVFVLGDMNEREEYYDRMTRGTDLEASNGPDGKRPKKFGIDWIFGSPEVDFQGHVARRDALVKKTTDHPFVVSKATIRD